MAQVRSSITITVGFAILCAPGVADDGDASPAQPVSPPGFTEVTEAWGVGFRHRHGGTGERYMPETLGGGVAIFDFDLDGDWDLFFVDSGSLTGTDAKPESRLLRNDGGGRFVDVTEKAGLHSGVYGMGAAVGDVDGDGDPDLYVTGFGANRLWLNDGRGRFVDGTARSGTGDRSWSASAAFADADRDGDLDLYVANYVEFTLAAHRRCDNLGIEVYCHPSAYPATADRYFRNRGDGTFEEATAAAGFEVDRPYAGLGVAWIDLTGDGWIDLVVANDSQANFLFRNDGDGSFTETALLSGVAYGASSAPEAGMGIAVNDADGDGRFDFVVTNFELETHAFYRNLGGALFRDVRFQSGIAEDSLFDLAFGVASGDFDLDGDEDLVAANGHVLDNAAQFHERSRFAQRNRYWRNRGDGVFEQVGAGFGQEAVSRALATGDLDHDGDLELVIVNNDGPAEVYAGEATGSWVSVEPGAAGEARSPAGYRIMLTEPDGRRQWRAGIGGGSYLTRHAPALHFGLRGPGPVTLRVESPGGGPARRLTAPASRRLRLPAR